MSTRFTPVLLAIILVAIPAFAQPQSDRQSKRIEFFELKIRPVLQQQCVKCHGVRKSKNNLRLDSRQALLKGGKHGPAVVPGQPAKSLLLKAIRHTDDDLKMPPGRKLSHRVIDDFESWLSDGAVWSPIPKPATGSDESSGSSKSENHWAFQPLKPVEPPRDPTGWAEHPIDRFIAAKLQSKGLRPGRSADKESLARRVYFDLIGLPPTPGQMAAILDDEAAPAFDRLLDRMLASPRYGERWGRHWLDVARYADTVGNNADYPIPEARLYRNYVIDAFAADKPYDQFIQEQIAGDIIARDILARRGSRQKYSERIIATGFIALSRQFGNYRYEDPHLIIEDTIDTIGRGVLGLTLRCARCHDHKFDPISTRDYYSLHGIFASTQYPFAGSEAASFTDRLVPIVPPDEFDSLIEPQRKNIAAMRSKIDELEHNSDEARKYRKWKTDANRLLSEIHELEREGGDARRLRDELSRIDLYAAESYLVGKTKPLKREIDRLERKVGVVKAFAVGEGAPTNVRVHLGGDPTRWGPEVVRGFPWVLASRPSDPAIPLTVSGRLQLARWLTRPNTPAGSLTARVMANRIWQWHFGKGLVTTPSNFGDQGAAPTHPELLDWLAGRFIKNGWSIKQMHRLILSSKTWQLASDDDPRNADDSGNRWYWRFDRRRLDAESIRDAMLAVSGHLNLNRPGPHPFPDRTTFKYTQHDPFRAVYPSNHRSVYLMTQRFQRHPYLALFDGPDTNTTTAARRTTTVPLQALYLMNNKFVFRQAEGLARQLINSLNDSRRRIDLAHRLAWSRPATRDEIKNGAAYISQYLAAIEVQAAAGKTDGQAVNAVDDEAKAWASYARIMLTANEFFYID